MLPAGPPQLSGLAAQRSGPAAQNHCRTHGEKSRCLLQIQKLLEVLSPFLSNKRNLADMWTFNKVISTMTDGDFAWQQIRYIHHCFPSNGTLPDQFYLIMVFKKELISG